MNRFNLALSVALTLAFSGAVPAWAQTAAPKPRIEKAADLPRFTYKLEVDPA
jgi:hypothetical protein